MNTSVAKSGMSETMRSRAFWSPSLQWFMSYPRTMVKVRSLAKGRAFTLSDSSCIFSDAPSSSRKEKSSTPSGRQARVSSSTKRASR